MASIVHPMHRIMLLHSITTGSITVSHDNRHTNTRDTHSTLRIFDADCMISDPKHINCNLVLAIWSLVKVSPLTWSPAEHGKRHQDNKAMLCPDIHKEIISVEMDAVASGQHTLAAPHPSPCHSLRGTRFLVKTSNCRMDKNQCLDNEHTLRQDSNPVPGSWQE